MKTQLPAVLGRLGRISNGLDIGFSDVAFVELFRASGVGRWMSVAIDAAGFATLSAGLPPGTVHRIGAGAALPFEDCQFGVVVLDGSALSLPLVREIHRVLKPGGWLLFERRELVRHGPDSTSAEIYNSFLRAGFNVTSLVRSPWWTRFTQGGRTLTVCATRKNWREAKGLAAR